MSFIVHRVGTWDAEYGDLDDVQIFQTLAGALDYVADVFRGVEGALLTDSEFANGLLQSFSVVRDDGEDGYFTLAVYSRLALDDESDRLAEDIRLMGEDPCALSNIIGVTLLVQ